MPRVYVRGEIGTSQVFEDIEFDPQDDYSVRSAIAFAVEREHPSQSRLREVRKLSTRKGGVNPQWRFVA